MRRLPVAIGAVERAHVAYWLFGAIWPLVSMKSFERVTGNKRDEWLVRTVALLMLSVVVTLETLRRDRRGERSLRVLGATSAGALGSVALIGPLVGRISPVYLADALVDSVLALLWVAARGRGTGKPQRGFPPTIGDAEQETHDPEPRRRDDR